jgi:GntR family transcriptional regulator, carbon starvation induced regulator
MARERQGRSLTEDVYQSVRGDILFGRRRPGSRLQLNELAEEHRVSLSVVREAVTRLASEDLVEATPQRGFRVRSLSVADLHDLTWVRVQLETLALRESIAKGDITWEGNLVAAHHRLAATPMFFEDGTGNEAWMQAHGEFHAALAGAAGSPTLARLREQLYDASELYRYWSAHLPHDSVRGGVTEEHKAICDAALARDADRAVELLTAHLYATAEQLASSATATIDPTDPEPVGD